MLRTSLISLFFAFTLSFTLQAQVLLVPDSKISFDEYQSQCQQSGFICISSYFQNWVQQKPTNKFDHLVQNMDLTSNQFNQQSLKQVQEILKTEMLNLDQLEQIIILVNQMKEEKIINSKATLLEKSLLGLKDILSSTQKLSLSEQEHYYLVMKKAVSKKDFLKLKSIMLQIPFYEIFYNKVPVALTAKATVAAETAPSLVIDHCEKAIVDEVIQGARLQVANHKTCSFNEQIAKVTTAVSTKITENRHWLITGAILVGTAILMSQYEVSFGN